MFTLYMVGVVWLVWMCFRTPSQNAFGRRQNLGWSSSGCGPASFIAQLGHKNRRLEFVVFLLLQCVISKINKEND